MTTKLFLFLFVTGAFLQEHAVGQEIKTFAMKGVRELGGSISFQDIERVENGTTGNPTTVYSIQPYLGFFIFDQVEFSIPVSFTRIRSGDEYFTELRFFLAPSYHLNIDEQTYPFLEGLFGYATQSHGPTRMGFSWGGRGGLKVGVTDKGLLNVAMQYLFVTLNRSSETERNGMNEFTFSFGFSIWY